MADHAALLGASTAQSTLLVLFIPSRDRFDQPIDQDHWVGQALALLRNSGNWQVGEARQLPTFAVLPLWGI